MTRHLSYLLTILAAVSVVGCLTGCAHPASIQTPQGATAYTADQIVQRLNELQTATIQANQQGSLPDATAIPIVQFCVLSAKTLKATPQGWQQALIVAWAETKKAIPAADAQKLSAYLATVDLAIASLIGA